MSLFADNHFEESGKGLVVTSNIKSPSKIQQIKSDKVLTGKIYTTEWIVNWFSTKFIKHFPGNELQFRSVPCKYKYALIEKNLSLISMSTVFNHVCLTFRFFGKTTNTASWHFAWNPVHPQTASSK
jgi:hypothetical protein